MEKKKLYSTEELFGTGMSAPEQSSVPKKLYSTEELFGGVKSSVSIRPNTAEDWRHWNLGHSEEAIQTSNDLASGFAQAFGSLAAGVVKFGELMAPSVPIEVAFPGKDPASIMIRNWFNKQSSQLSQRGLSPGPAKELVQGAGAMVPTVAAATYGGLPLTGGVMGYGQGGVKEAALGAAGGAMMGGMFEVAGRLPAVLRAPANFGTGYLSSGGSVAQGLTGAVMGEAGAAKQGEIQDPLKPLKDIRQRAKRLEGKNAPIDPNDPARVIIKALREAEKLSATWRDILYLRHAETLPRAVEAARQKTGHESLFAALGELKGKLEKPDLTALKIPQTVIDDISFRIWNGPELPAPGERVTTAKAFNNLCQGKLPTTSEISLLSRVLGKDFTGAVISKWDTWKKIRLYALEGINIPRTLMASFDLSAPFRQGIFFVGRPKEFTGAIKDMHDFATSESAYQDAMSEIRNRPTYPLMLKAKLPFTEVGGLPQTTEERFYGAPLLEKLERFPVIGILGKTVHGSDRAFTGFRNKLMADVFDNMVFNAQRLGKDPYHDDTWLTQTGKLVAAGTGRGLGNKAQSVKMVLNATMFSAQLIGSRLKLMTDLVNPVYYAKADPLVRREFIQSWITFGTTVATMGTILAALGAKVTTDPTNPDFGKGRIGNTRIDFAGGFGQFARLFAQLGTGKMTSSVTGRTRYVGEGYGAPTRAEIIERFGETKANPIISLALNMLRGKDIAGNPINIPKEIASRFIPMIIQDTIDIANNDPKLIPASVLGVYGFGLQSYPTKENQDLYRFDSESQHGKEVTRQLAIKLVASGQQDKAREVMCDWNRKYERLMNDFEGQKGWSNGYLKTTSMKNHLFTLESAKNIISPKNEEEDITKKFTPKKYEVHRRWK